MHCNIYGPHFLIYGPTVQFLDEGINWTYQCLQKWRFCYIYISKNYFPIKLRKLNSFSCHCISYIFACWGYKYTNTCRMVWVWFLFELPIHFSRVFYFKLKIKHGRLRDMYTVKPRNEPMGLYNSYCIFEL